MLDKFGWKEGEQVDFYDKYEDKNYSLEYTGNGSTGAQSLI